MIPLERKIELLSKHLEAIKGFNSLLSASYLGEESAEKAALNYLPSTLSDDERRWLIEQVDTEEKEEEKSLKNLLYEMVSLLIDIDGVYEPVISLQIHPDLSGRVCEFHDDKEERLFGFDSPEHCISQMEAFLSSY